MIQVLRCDRCLNFIRDDNTIVYYPMENGAIGAPTYICWQCWDKMSIEEKKELDENSFIPPHTIEFVDIEE